MIRKFAAIDHNLHFRRLRRSKCDFLRDGGNGNGIFLKIQNGQLPLGRMLAAAELVRNRTAISAFGNCAVGYDRKGIRLAAFCRSVDPFGGIL